MTLLEDLLQQCTVKIIIPGGWGTGFFVAPGLILTCNHVVRKAADLQITVFYPTRQQTLSAVVKAKADDGKTLDLALVELSEPLSDHPCVFLDEEPVAIGQALYSYGYLESYTNAAPVRPVNEGFTGDTPPLLKLQGAQIEKGISGAALLNLKTGKVCGMVKETRAAGFDLGGGAIPTRVILEQFPELRSLQQAFHGCDQRWVNLITPQPEINFQPYLESIATTYEKWWRYYTLTDAESKQRQVQESAPMFDFGLMVQTVQKQECEQPQQEKVERFSVLDGLRKYVLGQKPEPVLLVGRPGSGKSTTLAKLLLEEASTQKSEFLENSDFSASIPVLVELRYWQGSLSDLIHNAIARHDPTLKAVSLDRLLTNALLLFDGVNELPSEEARSQLAAFRRNHPNLPMIFTTRDLSLGGDLGIERKLEMLPLTESQMQAFIRVYIPGQAEAMLRQLKDRLREFGQTPLLLWMLCEVFQQAPNNQLPSNLGGVFQAFTKMYEESSVRKHDVALLKGDVRPLSDRRLWKKALMAIAAIMMQGTTLVDFRVAIHREEAEQELSRIFPNETFPVRDILDDLLKYHLLQNRSADQIEFRHQLLQEYYAAEYLLRLLPNLSDEQLKQDYLNYLKWTEPVALMLALLEEEAQALRVVRLGLDVDLRLGAQLAGKVKPAFQLRTVRLVESLEVPSWLEAKLLGETKTDVAVSRLIKLLENANDDVRTNAAEALGKIGGEVAISGLLKLVRTPRLHGLYARDQAIYRLGEIGAEIAVPDLVELVKYHLDYVRDIAGRALVKIGSKTAIPRLLQLMEYVEYNYSDVTGTRQSSSLDVINVASSTLVKIADETAIHSLLKLMEHEDGEVRLHAAHVLGEISSEPMISCLIELIKYGNLGTIVYREAVAALGKIGSEAAIPTLIQAIEDADIIVRKNAITALGKIGSEAAIPALIQAIEDADIIVRKNAITALGKIGSEAAIPTLIQAIGNIDIGMRESAAALGNIGSGVAIPVLVQAIRDQNCSVRWSAAQALGKIGSEAAIAVLAQAIRDADISVRQSAATALGNIGSEAAIAVLAQAIDADISVRQSAATALGNIGSGVAIPALVQAIRDADISVRQSAATALGKIGSEAAIPVLVQAIRDENRSVRWSAATALGEIGSEAAIPALAQAIRDTDISVRQSAAKALGKIRYEAAVLVLFASIEDSSGYMCRIAMQSLSRFKNDCVAYILPDITKTLFTAKIGKDLFDTIQAIQSNCKFYNYEIFRANLAAQKADRQTNPKSDPNAITIQTLESLTIMTDKAPIFNQQRATIGVNYAAEGSKIEFTQHTSSSEQTFEILLTDYEQFIEQLQQKYPNLADATTVPQIIEVEAKLLEAQDRQRWQNFLNLKRLWNGGKKAGIKVGEHFAENNVWAKGAIAFLEGVSEDGK